MDPEAATVQMMASTMRSPLGNRIKWPADYSSG
jgi:hypothetical protein